jgi:hypothetical protein
MKCPKCGGLDVSKYSAAYFINLVGGLIFLPLGIFLLRMFTGSLNDPIMKGFTGLGAMGVVGAWSLFFGAKLLFKYSRALRFRLFDYRCTKCGFHWKQREGDEYSGVESHIQALDNKDASVRAEAVEALGQLGGAKGAGSLIQAMNDEDLNVRKKVAEALGNIGDEAAVEAIIQSEDGKEMKDYILYTLAKIGDARATEFILQASRSQSSVIKVHAWNALKRITNREAVELLIMALKHENKFVRASAAEALGNTGSVQAQEALTKAIEDSSFRVRSAVKKALQKIKV